MKLFYGIVALTVLAFLFAAFSVTQAQRNARNRRVDLCHQTNTIKTILRNEHAVKLHRIEVYLKKHPNGAPKLGISRQDLLNSEADERSVLAAVAPSDCK